MYYTIARTYQIFQYILANFPINNNPLESRIRPLLYESNHVIYQILLILHQSQPNLHQLKQLFSVLYRDDEALDPLIREWGRASIWMEITPSNVVQHRLDLYQSIQKDLERLVPYIKGIYGEEDTRYIVPPLYRKEVGANY
ncbi:hypothetical protein [Salinibacillus xinjiangensis]|uniref:Uncharacterized protein n=1 Tax=Salinibacillus xinjiangensis TaxID=1229268 RepID=A0A6G1X9N3_9BACI|nr:hypothetical protein [Salinibacillus xinjiangensis]MRG87615.1 hypothetical protein [Salinibacillus xinjiangensis]